MRVVAGRLGGRRLSSPPGRSTDVRPTSDRARETLFALLGDVSDLLVLDLFCGTGALAIEALGIGNRCELVRGDAIRYLERSDEKFGLILCDPPYRLADRLEPQLAQHLPPRLARFSRLAVESSARRPLELELPKIKLVAERRVGEALIRIYVRE